MKWAPWKWKKCTLFPLRRCCPFFLKYGLKSSMLSYSSFSPSSFCNSNTSFIFFKIQAIISLFWFKWPTQFKIWGTEKTYVILQPLSTHLPATTTPVSILQNQGNQLFFKECLYVRKNKASTWPLFFFFKKKKTIYVLQNIPWSANWSATSLSGQTSQGVLSEFNKPQAVNYRKSILHLNYNL